jgi:hypothetical protein
MFHTNPYQKEEKRLTHQFVGIEEACFARATVTLGENDGSREQNSE